MRHLSHDSEGREVFAGLTLDETEWYLAYLADERGESLSGDAREKAADRFLELSDRHERARQEILRAEREARRAGPKH